MAISSVDRYGVYADVIPPICTDAIATICAVDKTIIAAVDKLAISIGSNW